MVRMEVGNDEGVDRGLVEPELCEAFGQGRPARLPVGPTIDEKQPIVSLDGVGIDPRR
jgi:hypothetical protein